MSKKNKDFAICSFCGRSEQDVDKLVSGPNVYICDNCIQLCASILNKPQTTDTPCPVNTSTFSAQDMTLLKPKEIKEKIDKFVVGQEEAKKAISVAAVSYTHLTLPTIYSV